ncbi:sulfotransferase family protein [Formosa sp. 4Alg 33]|uniref:sulfotransferase family protein n=1 Tax=Formosa sp. 4Alg 33 TaxID=3382189 RepID=UPI003D9C1783
MSNKVFCIGLNKTGTSSLHEAFNILGLKSVHYKDDHGNDIKEIILNNYLSGHDILKGLEAYDAFSDWDQEQYTIEIFKAFNEQYPGSKFILNTRDLKGWLDSREKHVKNNQIKKRKDPQADIVWLDIDREAWETQFKKHYQEANAYFKGRTDNFLVFDVINGDGWETLCPFLNVPIPNVPFPKKNVASDKKLYRRLIRKIKRYL